MCKSDQQPTNQQPKTKIVCSGSQEEEKLPSLLSPHASQLETDGVGKNDRGSMADSQDGAQNNKGFLPSPEMGESSDRGGSADSTTATVSQEEKKRLEAFRLEQARLDMIVQAANRKMVAVRSTRGSNAYYDQGFAAALSQHLEQTTQFSDSVEICLPAAHPTVPVYERLSQPAWDGIRVGFKDARGGLAGESPHAFFDRVAESFMEEVVPKKERLFANVEPMVESLL